MQPGVGARIVSHGSDGSGPSWAWTLAADAHVLVVLAIVIPAIRPRVRTKVSVLTENWFFSD